MVIYNVTTHVEPSIEQEWLLWMRQIHIPKMLATQKFTNSKIYKVINEQDQGGISYAVQYYSDSQELLKQYFEKEAPLFNKEEKKSYSKAILYTEKAIDYAKAYKLNNKLADCYLQLATIFFELEKNDLAIDYYIRAISIYSKSEPKTNIALSYYSLGKCYLKKNNIAFAEIYFEKATGDGWEFEKRFRHPLSKMDGGIYNKDSHVYKIDLTRSQHKALDNIYLKHFPSSD